MKTISENERKTSGDFEWLLRDPEMEKRATESAQSLQPYSDEEIEALYQQQTQTEGE